MPSASLLEVALRQPTKSAIPEFIVYGSRYFHRATGSDHQRRATSPFRYQRRQLFSTISSTRRAQPRPIVLSVCGHTQPKDGYPCTGLRIRAGGQRSTHGRCRNRLASASLCCCRPWLLLMAGQLEVVRQGRRQFLFAAGGPHQRLDKPSSFSRQNEIGQSHSASLS
jgi:hypothetical protein